MIQIMKAKLIIIINLKIKLTDRYYSKYYLNSAKKIRNEHLNNNKSEINPIKHIINFND